MPRMGEGPYLVVLLYLLTYGAATDNGDMSDITQHRAPPSPTLNDVESSEQDSRALHPLDHRVVAGARIPNHNPLFDRGRDITVVEDSGQFGPKVWATNIVDGDGPLVGGRPTHSGQSLTFTVVALDTSLFDGAGGQPQIASDGMLTFRPAPDQCGATTVSVVLRDDGNPNCVDGVLSNGMMFVCPGACNPTDCHVSAQVDFVITVLCVNDAPFFNDLGDQTVPEDSSTVTVVNWAYAINKGAGDSRPAITRFELEQHLMWTTTNNNPTLFTIEPRIVWDPSNPSTADLVFEPAPGQCGVAVVTVGLQDNGGTANMGRDTMTPPHTFQITITCDNDPPSFVCGADIRIDEDAGAYRHPNWATQISKGNRAMDASEDRQMLFFDLQFVNPTHANLFLVPPTLNTVTGELTFEARPNANSFGQVVELYVRLRDDGGMAPRDKSCDPITSCCKLRIVINPVNDPPSFTCGPDILVCEDLMNLPVAPTPPIYTDGNGWAKNINIGAPNEGVGLGFEGQRMVFDLINNNPAMFARGPSIDEQGTLTFELVPDANGVATVTVNSRDTGPPGPPGGNQGPTCVFTITVLPVSDPPAFTLTVPSPLVVTEDAPPNATDWPNFATDIIRGPSDEASQTIEFTVTNDNMALFTVQPHIEMISTSTGRLRFELAPDACGLANLNILLTDTGSIEMCQGKGKNSVSRPFQIKVDCVNDPPTFNLGPACCAKQQSCTGDICAIILCEDEALNGHTISSFATNIRPGPDKFDENSQKVSFSVSTDNDNLFSKRPEISQAGTLTFSTTKDAFGTAIMTVIGTDDGSPPRSSQAHTYSITIRPSNDPPTFDIRSNLLGTAVVECTAPWDTAACVLPTNAPQCTRTFPNWIQNIRPGNPSTGPGPANEASQTVSFSVLVDQAAASLFDQPPSIDPLSGTLSFTTKVSANTPTPITLTVVATDDGGTGQGGVVNGMATCPGSHRTVKTMELEILPVNNPPCFTCGGNVEVLEDAGPTTRLSYVQNIKAGPPDEATTQQLSFSLTASQPTLFKDLPKIDVASGTLSFTPGTDQCGSTEVQVMLDDGQATSNMASCKFTLSIIPVNDRPSFRGLGEVTVNEDAGPVCMQWIKSASAGPLESFDQGTCDRQTIRYEVMNTNHPLFEVQPTLSSTGELCFHPAKDFCGKSTVSVVLIDSGGVQHSGVDRSETTSFPITVTCINDAPSFRMGTSVVVCEDAGPQVIPAWCSGQTPGPLINENCPPDQQTLTFRLTSDNPDLFLVQPAVDRDSCSLSFTPAPDANGVANVQVVLCDDGNSVPPHRNCAPADTFTITVRPVNDAPSFTKGRDVVVQEDAPPYFVPAWAKEIRRGPTVVPGSEVKQSLQFLVQVDRPELFSVQPAIAPDTGDLTFTGARDANGVAQIRACLRDSGGKVAARQHTLNNGVPVAPVPLPPGTNGLSSCKDGQDTYCQDFAITITPCNDPPSFTRAGNVEVQEDSGPALVARWMEQLSPGPPDERHQVLEVVRLETPSDKRHLFAALPSLSASTGDLTFTPAANQAGDATITIVLKDNGGTANGCNDLYRGTFTITIHPINDAPSFARGPDVAVLEDSAKYVKPWASNILAGPAEPKQTVRFEVVAAVPALFTEQPSITPDGVLSFHPAPNAFGVTTVSVQLIDDGGLPEKDRSEVVLVNVEIRPVNDPPTFSKGKDVVVLEDASPVCMRGWATDISPGVDNEKGQVVSFTATPRCCAIFASGPTVDPNTGDMCFTLNPHAFGTVTIDLVARDTGGTANGGVDASSPVPFSVTVEPVNDPPFFLKGADITVLEDAVDQVFPAWARQISPGPFEDAQSVMFSVSCDAGLFAVQPKVWAASGDLTFTPGRDRNGEVMAVVTLTDNGGTANGGINSYTASLFINIVPVNDPPRFDVGVDVVVLEDAPPTLIPGWASGMSPGPADEAGQRLVFIVSPDNPAAFLAAPEVSATTGGLKFTVAPNYNGQVAVTLTLTDDGGVANGGSDTAPSATFRITVTPQNDPPSYRPGAPTIIVPSGSGPFSRVWATNIAGGPPDEPQGVVFTLTNNNPTLFTQQPAIAPDGTLRFTPAPNAIGNATVVVLVRDTDGASGAPTQFQVVVGSPQTTVIRAILDASYEAFNPTLFRSVVARHMQIPVERVLVHSVEPNTAVDFQFVERDPADTTAPTAQQLTDSFLSMRSEPLRADLQLLEAYPKGAPPGLPPPTLATPGGGGGGDRGVWVAVIVILCLVVVAGVAGAVFWWRRRQSRRKSAGEASPEGIHPTEPPRDLYAEKDPAPLPPHVPPENPITLAFSSATPLPSEGVVIYEEPLPPLPPPPPPPPPPVHSVPHQVEEWLRGTSTTDFLSQPSVDAVSTDYPFINPRHR